MKEIYKNLYQFSVYIQQMDFTIHQYLYVSEPSILFAAGTVQQAQKNLPEIKNLLGEKELKYIFVSHMESDEAGGISIFKNEFPNVSVICSNLAERELFGFGYTGKIKSAKGGECINDGKLKLKFIDYPSEVHLQNGLLCFEENSGILYSSDLMLKFGNGCGKIIKSKWDCELKNVNDERIPEKKFIPLKNSLSEINPEFIAVGHGFCIECE